MLAFDADVLIYATQIGNPLGEPVAALFDTEPSINPIIGYGSTLLIPEILIRPTRYGDTAELSWLISFIGRLQLLDVTEEIATKAVTLGAKYGLKAADSIHLASAITAGADGFCTNNRISVAQ
jgi:predicted nucleic acid-binding protein